MRTIKLNLFTIFINILLLSELEGIAKLVALITLGAQTLTLAYFFDKEAQRVSKR